MMCPGMAGERLRVKRAFKVEINQEERFSDLSELVLTFGFL